MRLQGQFLKELGDPLRMLDLPDLSLHDILQIQLDKFEIFAIKALIHEVEPQGLKPTPQGDYLDVITCITLNLQLLMALSMSFLTM